MNIPHSHSNTTLGRENRGSVKPRSENLPGPLAPELTAILTGSQNEFIRYLQSRLGNRDEAEDVLQDFYVKVMTKGGQIRDSRTAGAWLRQVLKSVLVDYYRRQSATRKSQRDYAAEPPETSATQVNDFDRTGCACFREFVPALKDEYAEVLRRVDLAGESSQEVAAAVGTTPGNLRVRLHRARQALKRSMRLSCSECRSHGCFDSQGSGIEADEAASIH